MASEFSLRGKWLELLKQVASDVTRAAMIRDPVVGSGTSQVLGRSPRTAENHTSRAS
jgi:hypothetical protein